VAPEVVVGALEVPAEVATPEAVVETEVVATEDKPAE
jgi:hypothetical protein